MNEKRTWASVIAAPFWWLTGLIFNYPREPSVFLKEYLYTENALLVQEIQRLRRENSALNERMRVGMGSQQYNNMIAQAMQQQQMSLQQRSLGISSILFQKDK